MLIQPFTLPNWPWGGASATLRLYSNDDWTDENGVYHLKDNPDDIMAWYQRFTATVAGRVITFGDGLDLPATTLSPDRPNVVIHGVLFDETTTPRRRLFTSWQFPDDLDPLTFAQLTMVNRGRRRRMSDRYSTTTQVLRLIADAQITHTLAIGNVEMVDGAAVVGEDATTADAIISLSGQDDGVSGTLRVSARTVGEGFVITSSNGGDNGTVGWVMQEAS